MKKSILFLRPYYGFHVHSDAHGELGMRQDNDHVYPDLTLLTAATVLSESGEYRVTVLDAITEDRMLPDDLLLKLENEDIDIVILKTTGATFQPDLTLLKEIHKIKPEADLKIGGLAAKILKRWLTENASYINEIIEEPLDEYALRLVNKEVSLKLMPTPDYTMVNYRAYQDEIKGLRLTLIAGRGCPMHCLYCPYKLYYTRHEYRDTDMIVDNIRRLIELEPDEIQFRDQYFSADTEKVRELCEKIISQDLKARIVCETRLSSLDEGLLALMKKAGVSMICFGVESGDTSILKKYQSLKGETARIKELVDHARSLGIETMAFYIIGFPEETREMAQSTYQLAEYLDTDYVYFNEYEHCQFDPEHTLYTPELFPAFANRTSIEYPSVLNAAEREDLVLNFSHQYAMRKSQSQAYDAGYKKMMNAKEAIRILRPLVSDLNELSAAARKIRQGQV